MSTELSITDLRSGYGRAADILRGVTLAVTGGRITTVIGPNGAGKSTLLKTIAGLVPVRGGELTLNGTSLAATPATNRVRIGVTLCGQGRTNFGDMTVEENMLLAGFTLPRKKLRERLDAVRELDATVAGRWHSKVSSMSGGQQQAVEISMALMTEPAVLMLDEPSLGLSPTARTAVFERIRTIANTGVCVVIVEQNVKAAAMVSDRLIVLDRGVVALDGTPHSVMADDTLRRVYVGGITTASVTKA